MRLFFTAVLLALAVSGCRSGQAPEVPDWRGKEPGTAYLGDDVLWRPREWLIFHMLDDKGTGFRLRFTVRDMNTYVHGPAPVLFRAVAPDGRIVAGEFLPDDGVTGGDFSCQDGIYDPYADFRYRQWHRVNSPGGIPPEKRRSPYLSHPEKLPYRTVVLSVPAAGKGVYRIVVAGRWDHWISVTPDRPLMTGVHPGAGPLYVNGSTLDRSYFYVPAAAGDIGLAVTEEVPPYRCGMTLEDDRGQVLKQADADGFCTWFDLKPAGETVCRLDLCGTGWSGICLHGRGFPFLLCPDAATAERLRGGMEIDSRGRETFHACIRELNSWADSLTRKDLEVNVTLSPQQHKAVLEGECGIGGIRVSLENAARIIDAQNVDPASPEFGTVSRVVPGVDNLNCLALAAGCDRPDNPYYGNPGLIRRVLLGMLAQIRRFDPAFRFEANDFPYEAAKHPTTYFQLPVRSNWYGLGLDSGFVDAVLLLNPVADRGLPEKAIAAYKQSLRLWAMGRMNMNAGEVANQWGWNYFQMKKIANLLGDPEIDAAIRRNATLVSTPNLFGRINPDRTPFDRKIGRLDADCGLTPSGYMPEQLGFDGEYSCEQTLLWGKIWRFTRQDCIVDWFDKFNQLKTFLTLSRTGDAPDTPFSQSCSPTDLNFRTRYMTHKNGQPQEMIGRVKFLDLWFPKKGMVPAEPWPCLTPTPFVKVIDDKFFFINTKTYYAILYGGPRQPLWANWGAPVFRGNSVNFAGYEGPGYGGWGVSANKPGGISALYVKGCGPVSLGQNNTVMDSDTVWGKALHPLFEVWRKEDVDPAEFAACYARPEVRFDAKKREYVLNELVPYVPLAVKRTLAFSDDCIDVTVEVRALEAFRCRELNYSIPFFADRRRVTLIDGAHRIPVTLKPVLTPTRPPKPDGGLERGRVGETRLRANVLEIASEDGKGVEYSFDRPQEFRILQPFRYREVAPAGGSFVMTLPDEFAQNTVVRFSYRIRILGI